MRIKTGVYAIAAKDTEGDELIYIGGSFDIDKRFSWHKSRMKHGLHHCKELQVVYFNNPDSLIYEIIEEVDEIELGEAEQTWKDYFENETDIEVVSKNDIFRFRGRMPEDIKKKLSRIQSGQGNGNSKLSNDDTRNIKLLINKGFKNKDIFEMYKYKGIHVNTISMIRQGARWCNVS